MKPSLTKGELVNYALLGADHDYAQQLRKLAQMRRRFPGIEARARHIIQRETAAHARTFVKKNGRKSDGTERG